MSPSRPFHTFVISLRKDQHRRDCLGAQLDGLDIPYSIVDAVHGGSLSDAELDASYDRARAIRLFNRELLKGEIGCALSHVKAYRTMVEQGIDAALILEDDACLFDPALPGVLEKLARLYPADTPAVVLLNHVPRYDGNSAVRLDPDHVVYEAYRGVHAHGYVITRAAAQRLIDLLYPVYVVADKWEYFQEQGVPVKALVPYVIGLTEASLCSSIDAQGPRTEKTTRGPNPAYYLRKYVGQLLFFVRSRPRIRIERQERSALDLH